MAGIGCGIVLKMHAIIDEYHTQMSLVDSMRSSRKLKKKKMTMNIVQMRSWNIVRDSKWQLYIFQEILSI